MLASQNVISFVECSWLLKLRMSDAMPPFPHTFMAYTRKIVPSLYIGEYDDNYDDSCRFVKLSGAYSVLA
jgi:hypothetical protein